MKWTQVSYTRGRPGLLKVQRGSSQWASKLWKTLPKRGSQGPQDVARGKEATQFRGPLQKYDRFAGDHLLEAAEAALRPAAHSAVDPGTLF